MAAIALIGALVVAAVLAVGVPLLLPWPQRLRWLLTSNADAVGTAGWALGGDVLDEVTVELVVADLVLIGHATGHTSAWLRGDRATLDASLDDRFRLERWQADATPLLLIERSHALALYGPDGCVTSLHRHAPTKEAT
jgi:hypothetical protein